MTAEAARARPVSRALLERGYETRASERSIRVSLAPGRIAGKERLPQRRVRGIRDRVFLLPRAPLPRPGRRAALRGSPPVRFESSPASRALAPLARLRPASMAVTSPYETLGVAPGASEREIRLAFLAAAARLHPDRGGDPSAFAAARAAWEVLREPGGRERAARAAAPATRGGARPNGAAPGALASEAGRRWCRNAEARARERAATSRDEQGGERRDPPSGRSGSGAAPSRGAGDESRREGAAAATSEGHARFGGADGSADRPSAARDGAPSAAGAAGSGSAPDSPLRAARAQLAAGRPRHALFQAREALRNVRRASHGDASHARLAKDAEALVRDAEDAVRKEEEGVLGADEWERSLEQTWGDL